MKTCKIDDCWHGMRKAEGTCLGLPYDTALTSIDGVTIHFWIKDEAAKQKLPDALKRARQERDIVGCTWCEGEPSGFWADNHILETAQCG